MTAPWTPVVRIKLKNALALMLVGALAPLAAFALIRKFGPLGLFPSSTLHSVLEVGGGMVALFVAALLLVLRPLRVADPVVLWSVPALLAMALTDIVHACLPVGDAFVFTHSLANLFGGLFFVLVLAPGFAKREPPWGPLLVVALPSVIGLMAWPLLDAETVPTMIYEGRFTSAAHLLNLVGGLGFLLAGLRFLHYGLRYRALNANILATHCFLFGCAALIFKFSALWDASWWYWHGLRLIAYMVVFVVVYHGAGAAFAAMRRNEHRLREAQHLGRLGHWEHDLETGRTTWSPEIYAMFGVDPQPVTDRLWISRIHRQDRERALAVVNAALAARRPFEVEFRVSAPGAAERRCHIRGAMERVRPAHETRIFGTIQDITTLRQAEIARAISESRYRALFESAADAIMVADLEGEFPRYVDCNQRAADLFGYTREELIGLTPRAVTPERQSDGTLSEAIVRSYMARVIAGERCTLELEYRRRDGSPIAAEVALCRFEVERHPFTVVMLRDISERKRLEAQLLQTRKLEALGRLAGGVAHDFNNQLTSILGFARDLAHQVTGPELRQEAQAIVQAAQRSAQLVSRLLTFARKGPLHQERVDLNRMCRQVLDEARFHLDHQVAVRFEPQSEPALMQADAARVHHAILNLIVNARDAMPQGGELRLETATVELDAKTCARFAETPEPGCYRRLVVSDTGVGMEPAVLHRLFEPFFSTKDHGQGTGLGLSSVYGTLVLHGGAIDVHSEPGRGSTFALYFPAASVLDQAPAPALAEQPKPREAPWSGPPPPTSPGDSDTSRLEPGQSGDLRTARVLVVDDDEALRNFLSVALGASGYAVSCAANGREALALLDNGEAAPDLVLLDLIMPVMDGAATFHELRRRRPDLPVILCSGYSFETEIEPLLNNGARLFLAKPFDLDALLLGMRHALGTRADGCNKMMDGVGARCTRPKGVG